MPKNPPARTRSSAHARARACAHRRPSRQTAWPRASRPPSPCPLPTFAVPPSCVAAEVGAGCGGWLGSHAGRLPFAAESASGGSSEAVSSLRGSGRPDPQPAGVPPGGDRRRPGRAAALCPLAEGPSRSQQFSAARLSSIRKVAGGINGQSHLGRCDSPRKYDPPWLWEICLE